MASHERYRPDRRRIRRGRHGFTLIELFVVIAILSILTAFLFPIFAKAREKARQSACLSNQKQIGTGLTIYLQDYDDTYPMVRLPDETHTTRKVDWNTYATSRNNWKRALLAYVKSPSVFLCPSNDYAWESNGNSVTNAPGDDTNAYYKPIGKFDGPQLPTSYGLNETFHPGTPSLWGEENRPREMAELVHPAELVFLAESRAGYPGTNPAWLGIPSRNGPIWATCRPTTTAATSSSRTPTPGG